jgi:hypothetical protein
LLKILKNKKNNTFIVSERQYIGIIATINSFRSTLASCEEKRRRSNQNNIYTGQIRIGSTAIDDDTGRIDTWRLGS